jgi:hypothetical protein
MSQHGSYTCAAAAVSLSLVWPGGRFRENALTCKTLYKNLLVNDPSLRAFLDLLVLNTRRRNIPLAFKLASPPSSRHVRRYI